MDSQYNITAAQLSMDELLQDLQVPGSTVSLQMDRADDAGIVDDLTFAELFTQDAIFKQLEVDTNENSTTPTTPAEDDEALLAELIVGLPTTVTTPPAPPAAPYVHRRAPSQSAGMSSSTPSHTASTAAHSAIVGVASASSSLKLPGQDELETPEWDGIIPDRFENLEEEMISLIPYRELAKLMARSKMTEKQIGEAKKLRRRVKNRQSARVCSTRKRVTTKATEFTNAELHDSISQLTAQNQGLLQQHLQLQQQVVAMQKSQQDAIREKLAMEAQIQQMQKRLQDAQKAAAISGVNDAAPMDFPMPDALFAIAA